MKIELQGLRHVYPSGEEALKGVDLVLEGTEPVAIIGQNGSGKTTIVKHFNGILRATYGKVLIDGENISSRTTAQLFLESVRKEFEFGPRCIGMPLKEIQERLKKVSEMVGLADKLDVHPFDLTAAEKKFCTIGAVIMMDPSVIIFDEPTCGQDVEGNKRLHSIIETLKAENKLCITISHDMKFVTNNFKRVIVMCKGRVLLDGSVEEVFTQVDKIKESFVSPPPITRVSQGAGLGTVFTIAAFLKAFKAYK